MDSLPQTTLPIICGGTHYFIQHFLFPPKELSFDRPEEQRAARASDPLATRWTPPCPCPPKPRNMPPELGALLDTFWMPDASFPQGGQSHGEKLSEGIIPTSRPTATGNHELLSLWQVLNHVDPDEAKRWHWRDGRKVRRGIERWWERGGAKVQSQASGSTAASEGRQARWVSRWHDYRCSSSDSEHYSSGSSSTWTHCDLDLMVASTKWSATVSCRKSKNFAKLRPDCMARRETRTTRREYFKLSVSLRVKPGCIWKAGADCRLQGVRRP